MLASPTFLPGLVSITFRKLSTTEVIALVAQAGLTGIEWGGDIHVPHGEVGTAREVGQRTRDAGLQVAAYGSYYRLGAAGPDKFERIVDSAQALGTKIIRVWPGNVGSETADDAARATIVADARRCADLAAAAGITIACEWHGGTLTDTAASGKALLAEVNHPAFKTYWQPRTKMSFAHCLADMDAALPHLVGLHVFQWHEQTGDRLPLADGESTWRRYVDKARTGPVLPAAPFALIEFVRNDDPGQFLQDAAALKQFLA